jgi:MFS family permease
MHQDILGLEHRISSQGLHLQRIINSSTVPLPLYGKASDIWGRKPVIFVSIGFFELGSALCGASQTMNMLIASRVIQGFGGGGIMGLVNIIMSDIVSLRYVPCDVTDIVTARNGRHF